MFERLYPFIIYQCKIYANLYKSVTKHPSIDRESSYFEEISLYGDSKNGKGLLYDRI